MRHVLSWALYILSSFLMVGCSSLKEPIIQQYEPVTSYRYFYVTPTTVLTSGNGGVFGNKYGVYGGSVTNSLNPSDVISGTLIKQGMIRLPQLDPNLLEQTVIVNYGESGPEAIEWPDLDVDLEFESLQHPERYLLIIKRNALDFVGGRMI